MEEYYIKGFGLYDQFTLMKPGASVTQMKQLWAGADPMEPATEKRDKYSMSMYIESVKGDIPSSFSAITLGENASCCTSPPA